MRKILIILLSVGIGSFSFAQNLTVNEDTIIMEGPLNTASHDFLTQLHNNTANALDLRWSRTEVQMPGLWNSSVCIGLLCYSPQVSYGQFVEPLQPGDSTLISIYLTDDGSMPGPGIVDVTIYDIGDSVNTSVLIHSIYNSWPTGIDDPQQLNMISYPVPANQFINLSIPRKGKLMISNLIGTKIFEQTVNQSGVQIDCSQWSDGFYMASLLDEHGHILALQKLLVSHK